MLRYMFFIVILMYLFSVLLPGLHLGVMISSLSLLIVLVTIFQAKRFVQVLGGTFLLFGVVLLSTSGASWQQYILSFGPMLDLLTMFTLIPILGIPIKLGGYSGIQSVITKRVKSSGQLYMITSGISYFFSIFMNLATLPMTYYSIRPALDVIPVENKERFMSRAISRGFAMPLLWAPVTPIVGIVITMTGVSWVSILPYVIPLSIVGVGVDWYIGSRRANIMIHNKQDLSVHETAATIETTDPANRSRRVLQILLAIVIFNVVISLVESKFPYPFLILVSLMVIPFSFAWSLFLKKGKEFGDHLLNHLKTFSVSMKDQFFIYLSAGFFISTINISHANVMLDAWVNKFINFAGVEIFLILLPLIPLALAFLGLHPAVSLALMTEGLNPEVVGISPHILTVAMLAGAVSAFLVGPYNATLGLMSSIVKESSYKVSNWNLSFASIYIGCVMLYLFILQLFLS